MKKFLLLIFLVANFIIANSQSKGIVVGIGPRFALPVGGFGDTHSFGIGVELQCEYMFSKVVSGIGSINGTGFFGKKIGLINYSGVTYFPITFGARVYPSSSFFMGGQIGYGILTGHSSSSGGFAYQPQIGYNTNKLQLVFSYNALHKESTTIGHLALTGIIKIQNHNR